jgi:hypothetical protein
MKESLLTMLSSQVILCVLRQAKRREMLLMPKNQIAFRVVISDASA